jgi:hypothetical protein
VGPKRPSIDTICAMLPTPTTKNNEWTPYMRRLPAHRQLQDSLAGLNPLAIREWQMGWPIGWTDAAPLAMDRWQEWLRWHGPSCYGDR